LTAALEIPYGELPMGIAVPCSMLPPTDEITTNLGEDVLAFKRPKQALNSTIVPMVLTYK
jgi:hypothetical protein